MKTTPMITTIAMVFAMGLALSGPASADGSGHDGHTVVKPNAGLGNGGEGPGDTGDGDLDPGSSGASNKACRVAASVQMSKGIGLFKDGPSASASQECGIAELEVPR